MHIIQYLLNLGFRKFVFDGSGKVQLTGFANTSFTINEFKSILKFVPYDIGYDANGVEWRVINVYYENNIAFYDAYNGNNTIRFDNLSLFNAAEINAIYQNKIDNEINLIIEKIRQLDNACVPLNKNNSNDERYKKVLNVEVDKIIEKISDLDAYIPEDQQNKTYSKIIKLRCGDVAYDENGVQWKVLSVFEENDEIKIIAFNGINEKIFFEKELYVASEINNIYQTKLDYQIDVIVNKINKLEMLNSRKTKFSKGDNCIDKKSNSWTIVNIFNIKRNTKYQATNGKTTKIFDENDLKKNIKK